jgi:tetratricopeptide (TPR) repeat protein
MISPRSLNKEQWTLAATGAVSLLLLLGGVAGGTGAADDSVPQGAEMIHAWPGGRYLELPAEKVEQYWKKKIFVTQSAAKLQLPTLRPPEPPEEDVAAPLFRPAPSYEAYNRMGLAAKYPALSPGAPVADPGQLPAAAELDALRKLEEPEAKARPDRRGDREREFYVVKLKTGTQFEGELIDDKSEAILIKDRKTGQRLTFKKTEVHSTLTNRTFLEVWQQESAKIKGAKEAEERFKLAQKLFEWGMIPEAVGELKKALEARDKFPEAAQLLGQIYQESGNLDAALEVFLADDLHYEAGVILRALRFAEGALHEFEQAVQNNPRHQAAKLGLARVLLDLGRPADAAAVATDFFDKMGRAAETTNAQRAEGHAIRAAAQLRMGILEKAKQDLGEALRVEPGHAEALNAHGAVLALEGAWGAAGAEFVKAIRADQYRIEAWTNLATLCLLAGKAAEAEGLFAAAAQRDPASADAVAGQGLALLLAGKDPKPMLERALQIDPGHPGAHLALGHLRLKAGQDEEALQSFVAAIRSEYFFLPAYGGAASAYLRTARKQPDATPDRRVSAETLLRQVKDLDTTRPRGWVALGCVYAVLGRPDDARLALRMALNQYQQRNQAAEPLALYALGWVEYNYGQAETDEARMELALREFAQVAKLKETARDPFSQSIVQASESAIDAIEMWKVTSLRFNETFDVPDGRAVGTNWIEADDKYGLGITIEKGRAKFSGRQAIADWGVTQLGRDIPGDDFYAVEASFYPEKTDKTEYGLSLYYNQQGDTRIGFHVGIDVQGKVRFHGTASDPRDMDKTDMVTRGGWTEVKTPLPNPKEVTFRLTRGEKNRQQTLTLWYWDTAKSDWIVAQRDIPANLGGKGTWRVGVFCRAWTNQDVSLSVDNIRVYERARR